MAKLDYTQYKGEGALLCKFHQEMGYKTMKEVVEMIGRKKTDTAKGHYETASGILSNVVKNLYRDTMGIDPKSFDLKELIPINQPPTIVSYSVYKKEDKNNGYKNFLNAYFDQIIAEIGKAEKEIIVVDYLKTEFHIPKKNSVELNHKHMLYHDNYDRYLHAIESQIHKYPNMKYRRYYQSPLSQSSSRMSSEDSKRLGVDLIYRKTIEHFCILWEKKVKFEAYLLTCPIQPSSFMLIDGKVLLSEYLRYNKKGVSKPDILFIERKGADELSTPNVLIESHKYRLENVLERADPNECLLLTRESLKRYYLQLQEDYTKILAGRDIKNREYTERKLKKTEDKLDELKV